MKNLCAMVKISVDDFERAKQFYESILGIEITEMNVLDTQKEAGRP
jgi:predicted enzyme related to lactoylglutathione lyase